MKPHFPAVIAIFAMGFACKSADTRKPAPQTVSPETTVVVTKPARPAEHAESPSAAPGSATTLKANATRIIGAVISIESMDSLRFKAAIRVDSAFSIGDLPSFASAGSSITAVPRYVTTEAGEFDPGNHRNLRLRSVGTRKAGEPFSGKVTLQSPGSWVIIDADSI